MHRSLMMILAAALAALAAPASAQTMREVTITMIRTGWNVDMFAVVPAEDIANPAGCPTPNGYVSEKSLPGYETYYAAALTAIVARRRIVATVHNSECVGGTWPKLIGINLTSQ